jgi:transcriptional regulator with XRE-family HTH domain
VSEIGQRIGRRIRELRTTRAPRSSQEDLARRAHISVSFLSMIERGERVPHLETLSSLSQALSVSMGELVAAADPLGANYTEEVAARPLVDFVRENRLTVEDVQKILAVARSMSFKNGEAA